MGYLDVLNLCYKESNSRLLYIDQSCLTGFLFREVSMTMHRWMHRDSFDQIISQGLTIRFFPFVWLSFRFSYQTIQIANGMEFFPYSRNYVLLRPLKICASRIIIYKISKFPTLVMKVKLMSSELLSIFNMLYLHASNMLFLLRGKLIREKILEICLNTYEIYVYVIKSILLYLSFVKN